MRTVSGLVLPKRLGDDLGVHNDLGIHLRLIVRVQQNEKYILGTKQLKKLEHSFTLEIVISKAIITCHEASYQTINRFSRIYIEYTKKQAYVWRMPRNLLFE